ncbi:hypothetical protein EDB85DRAFT_1892111 [Lactarius pseudohatsudake]|nr:hypothetical protein EDB85DRAFT_1892111 [Lactarius pseudohatsudake]
MSSSVLSFGPQLDSHALSQSRFGPGTFAFGASGGNTECSFLFLESGQPPKSSPDVAWAGKRDGWPFCQLRNTTYFSKEKGQTIELEMSEKLEPLRVGTIDLQHSVVVAPVTRTHHWHRANKDRVHGGLAKTYYAQQAIVIAPRAATRYPIVPGIWSDAQVATWNRFVISMSHDYYSWVLGGAAAPTVRSREVILISSYRA